MSTNRRNTRDVRTPAGTRALPKTPSHVAPACFYSENLLTFRGGSARIRMFWLALGDPRALDVPRRRERPRPDGSSDVCLLQDYVLFSFGVAGSPGILVTGAAAQDGCAPDCGVQSAFRRDFQASAVSGRFGILSVRIGTFARCAREQGCPPRRSIPLSARSRSSVREVN